MADAPTYSTAFSEAIQTSLQHRLLQNLRATLVWANPEFGQAGTFDPGTDSITFIAVPDLTLTVASRVLSEGVTPDARAMSITTVSFATQPYGGLVLVTDLAKKKSPIDIVAAATERLAREARELIDKVSRDVIAASGTRFFGGTHTTRATIDASADLVTSARLRTLRATMYKNKIPLFDDHSYHLYVSPEVGLAIRNDANTGGFIQVRQYTDTTELISGEIGRSDGFRIMEVVNAPTFTGNGVTVHGSLALGSVQPFGTGDLQTLSTYHVPPGGDHNDPLAQREYMGWKVNFGVGVMSNSYYYVYESGVVAAL